jgi:hypothetical protein
VENGKIAGHGRKERYWWCDDGHLVFSKLDGRPNLVLSQGMEGGWHGYSHDYGHVSLRAARLRIRRVRGAQERSAFRGYGGPKILNGTEPTLTPCLA